MSDKASTPRFTKLYAPGLDRMARFLAPDGPGRVAGRLWLWLVEHSDHHNAVVVSAELLAKELGVSVRTIFTAVKALDKDGALAVAKIGTTNAYILNPAEVFKSAEDHKRFCGFSARAIVGFAENEGLRARLTHFAAADAGSARGGIASTIPDPRQIELEDAIASS